MKYIVVYIIIILGGTSLDTAAQKPTLDLLPYASGSLHPEAKIDTCIAYDSLFLTDSIAPLPVFERRKIMEPRSKTIKTVSQTKPSFYPLFIKKINPISFFIHFTALKF